MNFEALETGLRDLALGLAARVVERHLNADLSDYQGRQVECDCGHKACYRGRRDKHLETVLGRLRLERAYYHCPACGQGYCPRDRQLGLDGSGLSPAAVRMVCQVGARVSFAEGSLLLQELAALRIEAKQVERIAERLGCEVGADDARDDRPAQAPSAQTLYLGMDGTGIPMRGEALAGRQGKQPDGTAKTREVKLVTLWSAEQRDAEGTPVRDPGSVTYSAAIESAFSHDSHPEPSAFGQRVWREARRRGFDQAPRQVVLGDGAAWIWNLADEHFPNAIQILDLYHVKEHLHGVARALYGPDNELGRQWAKQRCEELEQGQFKALIKALQEHASRSQDEARKCIAYLQRNRHRIHYPKFRAQGLCVTTGVVEAGCKVAIGTRLKNTGMRWSLVGANAIIALRCCLLSDRFDAFWAQRYSLHHNSKSHSKLKTKTASA